MNSSRAVAAPESITFLTDDGATLVGTVFRPAVRIGSAVLVAGGLGISQRFYAAFATWLAAQGRLVMTFDLRGMGGSRFATGLGSLRGLDVDMLGWARLDFAAAVDRLVRLTGGKQVSVIGHSLGAHHAGMTSASAQKNIQTLVAVASGAGYWRDWAPASRRAAPLMLHLAVPVLTPLFGYFPGKRLGMVGDLPAPAALQWARWCRHPDFAWGAEPGLVRPSMEAARFPITAFSFTDDDAMTPTCTRKLLAAFRNAASELHVVRPDQFGLRSIGHVGAFRNDSCLPIWTLFADALGV